MATKKEQIGVRVDTDIVQAFRKKCIDEDVSQAEILGSLMELYAQGGIAIKRKITLEVKKPD